MNTARPKLKVPYEPIDYIIDFVSASLIIALLAFTFIAFKDLPDTIATHFDGSGKADGFSSKNNIWWIPGISFILFLGLFIINKFPHMHNYMVNITEENALKNYRFSTRIVRIVNFLSISLFAFIQYTMLSSSKSESANLGSWFLPIVVGFSILLPIGIIIYYRKINKT